MTNTSWVVSFCNSYAPLALWLAELFICFGLAMGIVMAAAEAYKLYRDARAIVPPDARAAAAPAAATPAIGEVIKSLVGLLTGAKAWLAIVILGVIPLWLAGTTAPAYCTTAAPQAAAPTAPTSA